MEPTILSLEGWMELMEEMSRPPADTPERRATFVRMRERREIIENLFLSGDSEVADPR
jgi:hypothetical protein